MGGPATGRGHRHVAVVRGVLRTDGGPLRRPRDDGHLATDVPGRVDPGVRRRGDHVLATSSRPPRRPRRPTGQLTPPTSPKGRHARDSSSSTTPAARLPNCSATRLPSRPISPNGRHARDSSYPAARLLDHPTAQSRRTADTPTTRLSTNSRHTTRLSTNSRHARWTSPSSRHARIHPLDLAEGSTRRSFAVAEQSTHR